MALSAGLLLAACGSGTAALAGSSGSSGGSTAPQQTPTVLSDLAVGSDPDDLRTSPVEVRFRLTDAESDAADLELGYVPPGGGAPVALALTGPTTNLVGLAATPAGVMHTRQWDFAAQLPTGTSHAPGYVVVASVTGGTGTATSPVVVLGNDAPAVSNLVAPVGEVSGIVPISFVLADSGGDAVDVLVEYDNLDDAAGWLPATPLGPGPTGLVTTPAGVSVTFLWNAPGDEPGLEFSGAVRFTPDDGTATGASVMTPALTLDNNAEPLALINGSAFFATPDVRRGIPLSLRVSDSEADAVQLVFQWRRPFESFPPLPSTASALAPLLADATVRRQNQIAGSFNVAYSGRALPAGPSQASLPELAGEHAFLVSAGVVGRSLQILREGTEPVAAAGTWASNPLSEPVDALVVGSGVTAVVLDRPAAGAWRLQELELATGVVVRVIATGVGDPNCLASTHVAGGALVASDLAGLWTVAEVDLGTGAVQPWLSAGGATVFGSVRGMLATGTSSAVITVHDALVGLDRSDPFAPTETALLTGLATPFGLVPDPSGKAGLYLAERDWIDPATSQPTGRVMGVDLTSLAVTTLPSGGLLVRPERLALARAGTRLLAVTDSVPVDGLRELRAVELGTGVGFELAAGLPDGTAGLATGPQDMTVACLTATDDLAVGGGVQQARAVTSYDVATTLVGVDVPFDPALTSRQRWRLEEQNTAVPTTPGGLERRFVWDSADLIESGAVVLRAVPYDSERGVATDTGVPRPVRFGVDVLPTSIGAGATDGVRAVRALDLNHDGLVDIVSANADANTVTIFYQDPEGSIPTAPDLALSGVVIVAPMVEPVDVEVADVDSDGDWDLVTANRGSDNFSVILQVAPGMFVTQLLNLGAGLDEPADVAAADLNGDGRIDLAIASEGSDRVFVFLQLALGLYLPVPSDVLGNGTTVGPNGLATGDLDGDGDLDVVVSCGGNDRIAVFLQGAPGSFPVAPSFTLGGAGITDAPSAVRVGDIDGDGWLDIVSANAGSNSLTTFVQTAPGVFPATPTHVLASVGGPVQPASLVLADANLDGALDVISVNGDGKATLFMYEPELDTFAAGEVSVDGEGALVDPRGVAAGDLNSDGLLDLVVANTGNDEVLLFSQRASGAFTAAPNWVAGSAIDTPGPAGLAVADLDADGDLDLVCANEDGNTLAVFSQFSPAVLGTTPHWRLGSSAATDGPRAVVAADLNADGLVDLASANGAGGDLALFFQAAGGVFASAPDLSLGQGLLGAPSAIHAADLDGDGDQDLVAANEVGNDLAIFFQDPAGVFPAAPSAVLGGIGLTDGPMDVCALDIDGDGDLDLVCANGLGDDLTCFLQQTPGVFSAVPGPVLGGVAWTAGARAVAVADLDGDGDLDLVSANEGANSLTVFLQTAPGVFAVAPDITLTDASLTGPTAVQARDVDGDGDLDLVCSNPGSSNLAIFLQTRPGVFGTAQVHGAPGVTTAPRSLLVLDLDGDGDTDLLTVDRVLDRIAVFFGSH